MAENLFYGWYDDASQAKDKPSYDPPHNGPCLYCGLPIDPENDVRTYSMMSMTSADVAGDEIVAVQHPYAARCYFYRIHRTCNERHGDGEKMDGIIWDMVKRNGD